MSKRDYFRLVLPFLLLLFANGLWALIGIIFHLSDLTTSICYAIFGVLLLYVMYYQRPYTKMELLAAQGADTNAHTFFPSVSKNAVAIALFSLGCYCFASGILTLLALVFPDIFSAYMEQTSNIALAGSPGIWIYSVLLAPVLEELCFRGITLPLLRERFGFYIANLIQAVLFSIIHASLIQIAYALVLGWILGLVRERFGKLGYCILFHSLFNLFNLPNMLLLAKRLSPLSQGFLLLCFGGFIVLFCVVFYRVKKKTA